MQIRIRQLLGFGVGIFALGALAVVAPGSAAAGEHGDGAVCEGYGPQAPRDIDAAAGANPVHFSVAPPAAKLNLCNIHFHTHAEHRAAAYSDPAAAEGEAAAGYMCGSREELGRRDLKQPRGPKCEGVAPGDTVEVHWVYTSCDVAPGPGLGSCLSDQCANPQLRVEAQVFVVANDDDALDFASFAYGGPVSGSPHQPKALPGDTGEPVIYLGSTTGPKYSEAVCSPLQVTWSVRPECATLDVASLGAWCADNPFNETGAHGVRPLVTHPKLLAPME